MQIIDGFLIEYQQESQTTRKHIERVPADQWNWKPHEKSFSMGQLASHIAEIPSWTDVCLNQDEFDMKPEEYETPQANSPEEALALFDKNNVKAIEAMQGQADENLLSMWTMKVDGKVALQLPKVVVLRAFILSHTIHHRGQMSVYLRIVGAPVPQTYGPSADEPDMIP